MSYNEKPLLKLYKYQNNTFKLQAIIDDYEAVSFEHSKYEAGQFSVQINYNIPNATKFEENMFIQFGNEKTDFGIIKNIKDSIGPDGKGSQIRIITGYDARILFKQRIIRNLNFADSWTWTGNGEKVMRELISAQCGDNAEEKRKLPIINIIPETCIGKEYTVSEAYSNLYDVLVTIATQTEIGWQISFSNNEMILEFYPGIDRHTTVRFDTDYNSLANGEYEISTDSYANTVYVGGKGSGENKDVYEGEIEDSSGNVPKGLERFECWDDSSSLENEDEYSNEAQAKLNEYSQMVSLSGNGLAKCPYEFRKQYDIGDIITVSFSGKSAIAQIISITEHWSKGAYDISFEFGKPIQDLSRQLNLLLSQIRTYQNTENNKTSNIKYYEIPTETEMPNKDVILDVIGFIGNVGTGKTFKLYFDSDSKVGAKTYHIYFKQLSGNGKLTLTSGVQGATNLELGGGTYVAIIYVDEEGNIGKVTGTSNYNDLENKPVVDTTYSGTSENAQSGTAVASALSSKNDVIVVTDYTDDEKHPITDTVWVNNLSSLDSDERNPKISYKRTWLQAWNYIVRKMNSVFHKFTNYINPPDPTNAYIKYIIVCPASMNYRCSGTGFISRSSATQNYGTQFDFTIFNASNGHNGYIKTRTFQAPSSRIADGQVVIINYNGVDYVALRLHTSGYYGSFFHWDVLSSSTSAPENFGTALSYTETDDIPYTNIESNFFENKLPPTTGSLNDITLIGTYSLYKSTLTDAPFNAYSSIGELNGNINVEQGYIATSTLILFQTLTVTLVGELHTWKRRWFSNTGEWSDWIELKICSKYSSEEKFTGDYYTDGKPIYCKTVDVIIPATSANGTAEQTSYPLEITIDSLIKFEGSVVSEGGGRYTFPIIYGNNYHYYGRCYISAGTNLIVWSNYTTLNNAVGKVVVYYTKSDVQTTSEGQTEIE